MLSREPDRPVSDTFESLIHRPARIAFRYGNPDTSSDTSTVTQTQDGWILVGNPPATLAKTGDGQTGASGTQLALSVALNAGTSAGSNQAADIYFTSDGGTLSSSIVTTDTNGNAAVTLTLPSSHGPVHLTAQGPFGLGHPAAVFSEAAQ